MENEKEKKDIKPNVKQQECIDNIHGKFLVLAGPGTGKTFTVIQRIKNMITQGIDPEKILCLTFTDAAANEMKKRLEKELQNQSTNVNIYTYHGFCFEIIENNPEEFELPDNFRIISEAASRSFLKECIDEIQPKALRTEKNDPYFYITQIKRNINSIKQNRITKEEFFYNIENNQDWQPSANLLKAKIAEKLAANNTKIKTDKNNLETIEKNIEKMKEVWEFYELYQEKMAKKHYLDFNDMISFILDKFANSPAFLEKIANQYEYILVDEYQDTNTSQNSIVFNLTHALKTENVFVVGDDDQIIYSFQGAKLDTIEKFLTEFPETKVICLTENMRSTQNILDASREVTKLDDNRLEENLNFAKYNITKSLTSKNEKLKDKNIKVRLNSYLDTLQEYNDIISEIDELVNSTSCPTDDKGNKKLSEIAILTRSNAELETFSEMLKIKGIPYELKEGKSIFTIKSSLLMYYYMQLLIAPDLHSDKIFKFMLSEPFSINSLDFETIYQNKSRHKSIIETLKEGLTSWKLHEPEKIKNFVETYDYLKKYKTNESLNNTILEIGSKTGIFQHFVNSEINRSENIAGIKKLLDEANGLADMNKTVTLEEFVDYLEIALNDDIEIKTDKAPVTQNAIQLSTYYSAKGREFEYVYMPTLLKNKWESDNKSLKPEIPLDPSEYKDEDELKAIKKADRIKVMYVGMTRAKHTLRLSYVQTDNGKAKKMSELLVPIQPLVEKHVSEEYSQGSFTEELAKIIIKRDYDYKTEFHSIINNYLKDKEFSATDLNVYLACPRQYLYDKILNLSSKDGNPDALSYGTSVHKACEEAIRFAKDKGFYPEREEFIKYFKQELNKNAMSSYQQRQIHEERGEKALNEYYPQLQNTPINSLETVEEKVKFKIDDITFKGFIDRIDKNEDGTYTIYDYKTGSAKTATMISPDGEHSDYYHQIGLYKYLYEQTTGRKVRETGFIFPEDYEKNLTVEFTEDEIKAIIQTYLDAVKSIKNYDFAPIENRKKEKDTCKYCAYKEFCDQEIL